MFVHYVFLVWYYVGSEENLLDIFEDENDAYNCVVMNEVFQYYEKFEKQPDKLVWVLEDRQFIVEKYEVK